MNRKTLSIMILMLLGMVAHSACAQSDESSDQQSGQPGLDRENAEAYTRYPAPDAGYVTDLADLLTNDEEEQIEQWLWEVEATTGVEIAVVTIFSIRDYPKSPYRGIEDFARGLFDRYGVGNLPENNGVLLLVAVRDREARIELGAGYGNLRDRDASRIMNGKIVPSFKRDDYAAGITKGVQAMVKEFSGARIGPNWPLLVLATALPIVALIGYSIYKNGKRGWGWVCAGLLIVFILAAFRVVRFASRHMAESSSGSSSSGGFGGGFGGGFSGGGGATGSW